MKSKPNKQLLLLGHPCCGAAYLSAVFSAYKYDIHRGDWDDGSLTVISAGESRQREMVHYIRNPVDAIPSIVDLDRKDPQNYNYRKGILHTKYGIKLDDYTPLNRAVLSFVTWNKMIEEQNPGFVVRVEESLSPVLEYIGWPFDHNLQPPEYDAGPRVSLDWSTLRPNVLQDLNDWCIKYGYQSIDKPQPKPQSKPQPKPRPKPRPKAKPKPQSKPRIRSVAPIIGRNSNIRHRLMHNVVVHTQAGADVTARERQRRVGFSVRK